jgi:hypothetical protein
MTPCRISTSPSKCSHTPGGSSEAAGADPRHVCTDTCAGELCWCSHRGRGRSAQEVLPKAASGMLALTGTPEKGNTSIDLHTSIELCRHSLASQHQMLLHYTLVMHLTTSCCVLLCTGCHLIAAANRRQGPRLPVHPALSRAPCTQGVDARG